MTRRLIARQKIQWQHLVSFAPRSTTVNEFLRYGSNIAKDINSDCLKARKIYCTQYGHNFTHALTGQARSENTVTEIFLDVLMAWVLLGLVKSRRAAAALTDAIIFILSCSLCRSAVSVEHLFSLITYQYSQLVQT